MLEAPQTITEGIHNVPKIAIGILIVILLFGTFVVGYDQDHLFSLV
jgi:hypothetical protein